MIENVWAKTYVMSLSLLGGGWARDILSQEDILYQDHIHVSGLNFFLKIRFDDKLFIPRRAVRFGGVKNILFQRIIEGVVRGFQQPFQFSKIKRETTNAEQNTQKKN